MAVLTSNPSFTAMKAKCLVLSGALLLAPTSLSFAENSNTVGRFAPPANPPTASGARRICGCLASKRITTVYLGR